MKTRTLAALALTLLGTACSPNLPTYQCTQDSDCNASGQSGGKCVGAYCAYMDTACPSGLRFDTSARGALASQCVSPVCGSTTLAAICSAGDAGTPVCVDLLTDNNNCGACGTVCPAGNQCAGGACKISCGSGLTSCGSGSSAFCTNLKTDVADCGACGKACKAGQLCSAGKCVETCAGGFAACPAAPAAATYCADLQSDGNNCGTCGNACPAGQSCSGGKCGCPTATPDLCGTAAATFCTSLQADPANCGMCGTACGPGQVCSMGVCTESCSGTYTACPAAPATATYCADLASDVNNCGTCNNVCPAGQSCVGSTCTCPTSTPNLCGTAPATFCTNVQTDSGNCGACSTACGPGQMCSGGMCVETCSTGFTACPTAAPTYCANTKDDVNNCGVCGKVCPAAQVCTAGACACSAKTPNACGSGATAYCTDIQSDSNNCGTCGTVCPGGTACGSGKCRILAECGRFSGTTAAAWSSVANQPGAFGGNGIGFTDLANPTSGSFFAIDGSSFWRYDLAPNTWSVPLAAPPTPISSYTGLTWIGGSIYVFDNTSLYKYTISSNTWTTVQSALPNTVSESQTTHDYLGNVYAVTCGSTCGGVGIGGLIAVYRPSTGGVAYITPSTSLGGAFEPRIAFDPCSSLLFIAPSYSGTSLYAVNPATAGTTTLASIPDSQMNDQFVADRSGHIYAGGNLSGAQYWEYTIPSNTWAKLTAAPPAAVGNCGTATIGPDGALYFTPGCTSSNPNAVYRLQLN